MSEDNISTIKGIYDAFGKGDVDTILAELTDDVDWSADASSDSAPWYGDRSGKDAVAKFFADIGGNIEVTRFEAKSFAANDDEVMVLLRFGATANSTGRSYEMNLHHYWHFTDGKVDTFRGSEDTEQTAKALND